jgi:hypothetical protein
MRQNSSSFPSRYGPWELILGPAAGYVCFLMWPCGQLLLQVRILKRKGLWGRCVQESAVFCTHAVYRRKKKRPGVT